MFHARASLFGEKMDPSILKKMEGLDYELAHHQQNRLFVIDKVYYDLSCLSPARIHITTCRFEEVKLSVGMEEIFRSNSLYHVSFLRQSGQMCTIAPPNTVPRCSNLFPTSITIYHLPMLPLTLTPGPFTLNRSGFRHTTSSTVGSMPVHHSRSFSTRGACPVINVCHDPYKPFTRSLVIEPFPIRRRRLLLISHFLLKALDAVEARYAPG